MNEIHKERKKFVYTVYKNIGLRKNQRITCLQTYKGKNNYR